MRRTQLGPGPARRALTAVAIAAVTAALLALAVPAAAQYAGTDRGFLVTPIRVPHGSEISGVGFGCSAGGTVTITIDGVPGVFTTVIAEDDSTYSFEDITIPLVLEVGSSYTARAHCDGDDDPADFTVICADGREPNAENECPEPPTTTSVPPTTTVAGGSGSTSDPLAFTGSSTTLLIQVAATLLGAGALFLVVSRRRPAAP